MTRTFLVGCSRAGLSLSSGGIVAGAGTVLTAQDAAAAMDAGAQFIVASDTDEVGIAASRSLEARQPITIKDLFDLPLKKKEKSWACGKK